MNITKLQQILTIINKYVNPICNNCVAEHDTLFLPLMNDHEISSQDEVELVRLGAHRDTDVGCWAVYT